MLFNYKEHRIFAFSDSHGMHKRLHIPEEADILLCAGDVVSGFGKDGMEDFFSWLLSHPAKLYMFVAGNHELFLEDSLEQTISLLPKKVVFLHDSSFEFDGISFGNISMRSLQSKEQNVQSATKMDFLITHIPPEGILDEGRGSLPLLLEVYRSQPRFHVFGHAHSCGNQS
jgi:predicted phosphodiesterase